MHPMTPKLPIPLLADSKKRYAPVKFIIKCPTVPGQTVCLVGSIKELKSWDISKAIRLSAINYTTENPIWETITHIPIPLNVSFEYKFFIISKKPGISWEHLQNFSARSLHLNEKCAYEIRHQFSSQKCELHKLNLQEASVQSLSKSTVFSYIVYENFIGRK